MGGFRDGLGFAFMSLLRQAAYLPDAMREQVSAAVGAVLFDEGRALLSRDTFRFGSLPWDPGRAGTA